MRISPLVPLIFAIGCVEAALDSGAGSSGGHPASGAELAVDIHGHTDVIGFHFAIERVACGPTDAFQPLLIEANVNLLDQVLPEDFDLLYHKVDDESHVLAADLFVSLEPGCYEIGAHPAQAFSGEDWTPSDDCAAARDGEVEVEDGLTAHTTLISQCTLPEGQE